MGRQSARWAGAEGRGAGAVCTGPAELTGADLKDCISNNSLSSNASLPSVQSCRRLRERRVASWAVSFERLLQDPVGVRYFSVSREEPGPAEQSVLCRDDQAGSAGCPRDSGTVRALSRLVARASPPWTATLSRAQRRVGWILPLVLSPGRVPGPPVLHRGLCSLPHWSFLGALRSQVPAFSSSKKCSAFGETAGSGSAVP